MKSKIYLYELEAEEGKILTDKVICKTSNYYKKITTENPEDFQEITFEEYEKIMEQFKEVL